MNTHKAMHQSRRKLKFPNTRSSSSSSSSSKTRGSLSKPFQGAHLTIGFQSLSRRVEKDCSRKVCPKSDITLIKKYQETKSFDRQIPTHKVNNRRFIIKGQQCVKWFCLQYLQSNISKISNRIQQDATGPSPQGWLGAHKSRAKLPGNDGEIW